MQNSFKVIKNKSLDINSVVCIGNFDGLHLGHQVVMERAKKLASLRQCACVMLSFSPLPRVYFQKRQKLHAHQLMDLRTKVQFLKKNGFDALALMPFNERTILWSPQTFVQEILVKKLKAKVVVVGREFGFGYQREGNVALLETLGNQFGFSVISLEPKLHPLAQLGAKIGSSIIKTYLQAGDVEKANLLLGRPYHLTGRIIAGKQRGRLIGFRTANIAIKMIIPLGGVYAVRIKLNNEEQKYNGVANIGFAPTLRGTSRCLEVHIFDFEKEIYGAMMDVEFLTKIRDEKKFNGVDELVSQIKTDCEQAKNFFVNLSQLTLESNNTRT